MNRIKYLKTKKGRDEWGQFIVEGEKAVNEIPDHWNIFYYACAERYANACDLSVFKKRAPCVTMRDSLFDAAADTVTPQGIMAVCDQKRYEMSAVLKPDCFLLMGECLSDPGNIGALIRTAAAAGADGVILTEGSGDLYNPKVLRAAAGAVLRIPVITDVALEPTVLRIKQAGVTVYAAHLKGAVMPYELDLQKACCFLIGNEAHGLSDIAASLADLRVRLPMPGGTESLNASVAGSLLLYEAVRQRISSKR